MPLVAYGLIRAPTVVGASRLRVKSVNSNAIHVSLFSLVVLVACFVSVFGFLTPKVHTRRAKSGIFHRFTWSVSFCTLPEIYHIQSFWFGFIPINANFMVLLYVSLLDVKI